MVQYKSEYEGPWASAKPVLFAYPTADIDQMVAEIERGYGEANE